MRNIIITLCVLFLTGCASPSLSTCNLERWQRLGASHAMSGGQFEDRLAVSSCSNETSVAYRMGFESGQERYCSYERGLIGGENGESPVKSCNDTKWDQYADGFVTGREIRATKQRLATIDAQMKVTRNHLRELESARTSGPLHKVDHEHLNLLRADIATLVSKRDSANRHLFSLRSNFELTRKRELSSL